MKYRAKLVRGVAYYLKDLVFRAGESVVIDEAVKKHLEEHAVDLITVDGASEPRQKFVFEPVEEDKKDSPVERIRKPA